MLARVFFEEPPPDERPAVITTSRATTWRELKGLGDSILNQNKGVRRRRVGLCFGSVEKGCAALAAMERLECDLFLLDGRVSEHQAMILADKLRLGVLLVENQGGPHPVLCQKELSNEAPWSGRATITILTSGTTGEPKAATHTWDSLARPVRKASSPSAPRWLLSYPPTLYAGLQVILQCLVNGGTLVVPSADSDPQSVARLLVSSGVQFASATPSYWRRLLMLASSDDLKRAQITQVTLGGEPVDQPLLDNLRRSFPGARLVHIYATTELGRCFSVTDGLAGFPVSYLKAPSPDGVELRVEGGELQVKSSNAMRGYDAYSSQHGSVDDWFATGDLVFIDGQRVFFAGRKTDMINVGGNKVHPIEVERVIRQVAGVTDVRVFGRSSSIAGQLVACEVVAEKGVDQGTVKERVVADCLAKLPAHQRPRFVDVVEQITLSSAAKTVRKPT
jgi:acyl-CoA synthetase (AMP-forming)/AMP-acid ligase II